jgi:hypothetical protein
MDETEKGLLTVLGVTAGMIVVAGFVSTGAPAISVELASQNALVLQLDWLQNLIERIDQLLEAVVDLLKTLQELFGGGGGD